MHDRTIHGILRLDQLYCVYLEYLQADLLNHFCPVILDAEGSLRHASIQQWHQSRPEGMEFLTRLSIVSVFSSLQLIAVLDDPHLVTMVAFFNVLVV